MTGYQNYAIGGLVFNDGMAYNGLKNRGFLRGDEKHSVYKSADCYVMPSVSEPFGITALESVANGTPTIISKQSGVSEILKNTLKVDFWDVDEMSNKIISCLKYEPLLTDLRNESTKEIPNFTAPAG